MWTETADAICSWVISAESSASIATWEPRFAAGELLVAGGAIAKVPIDSPRSDLSRTERQVVVALRVRLERLESAAAERDRRIREEMKKFREPIPLKDQLTAEVQAKVRKKQEEIDSRPENKAISNAMESLNQRLMRRLKPAGPGAIGQGQDTPHGYVRLFLRK